ncbi:P-loop containing nucleoside triphosphate hydrolase protein [Coniochaeta sp. 2T2.1]|nr:P-loop containing nucleoside triphosphate hydrolase protein [Coniochaeta sp. 2T2.1]
MPIDISDDEDVAPPRISSKSKGKRRLSLSDDAEVEVKVEWTDDSDDAYTKFKERKKKRRTVAPKGKAGANKKDECAKGKKKAGSTAPRTAAKSMDGPSAPDDYVDPDIPEYLRQRREDFDRDHKILKEAGLKLPPDYGDIEFSDDERRKKLEERPVFDKNSGIKPSREYKEIELEYSAGLIPASIAQYLRDYQIDGAKFLHQLFVYQKGGILGDDMGLGKTIQVIAFLTAAFGKTGDERDAKRMRKMRRAGDHWYPRILIVCPGSLIQNWKNELNRWGWWHADLFHGPTKDDVLQTAKAGRLEVMITTYVTYKNHRVGVNSIQWDAVVADECHVMKDRSSETTRAMNEINALCRIGLTGTAIQNKYEELWTLLNWTNPGQFGSLKEWEATIGKPLRDGQSHDATLHQLSVARKTAKKLVQNLLPPFFLRRMKSLIAHQLPKKSDKVVFCPLTDLQTEAYENFIESEMVELILTSSADCPCGSGHKRGWCCYQLLENGKPWQALVFPAMITLQKLANHLTLLIPSSSDPSPKQQSELNTLQTCIPNDWEDLYRNRESMMNLANPDFCGKWKVLKKLLRFWHESGDKVLVFSHSVRLLRILQHLFNNTSYTVSYLDGSLSYEERQAAVDNFNTDPGQFVFLISTKAGGVGLNITSANKVVIFDPHWNPSYDLQAQDRAYRIGQVRDVDVFRLISAGTIEEIVYARQIYKQQQANIGYNASTERRYFKGVQQQSHRKGEIFGLANLFSFHPDQVMLRDIVNKTNVAEARAGVNLTDIDMEKVTKDEDDDLKYIKKEETDDDDGGMSQLAELIKHENQEDFIKAQKPKNDAIAAILAAAGVEYTHENSEVIGSSKVEEQLSKRAEMAAAEVSQSQAAPLFMDEDANDVPEAANMKGFRFRYNPPPDVLKRQFCSMATEFGFQSATDFALVVESWTTEQRRNCLDAFYKRREARLLELELELERLKKDEVDEKDPSILKNEDVKLDNAKEEKLATDGAKEEKLEKDEIRIKKEEASPMDMNDNAGLDRVYIKKEEEIVNNISRLSREIEAMKQERAMADLVKVEDTEDDEDDEL